MSSAKPVSMDPVLLTEWLASRRLWVFAGLAVLYAVSFTGNWQWGRDSVHHVILAQSVLDSGEMRHPLGHERAVQPGSPYLIAGMLAVGGGDSLLPAHVAILFIGLLGLAVVYLWVKRFADSGTAVAVVVMLGVCESYFRYSFQLLAEMPFFLGAAMTLLGWELLRERPVRTTGWVVLFAGVAIMAVFRNVFVIFIAAMALAILIATARRRPWISVLAAGTVIVAGAAAVWLAWPIDIDPRTDLAIAIKPLLNPEQYFEAFFVKNLPDLLLEVTGEAVFAIDFGPVICAILSIAVLASTLALVRRRVFWGVLVAGFLAQWLVFWATDRYFLPLLPLVALGWWWAAAFAWRRLEPRYRDWVWGIMIIIWIGPNVFKSAEYAVRRHAATPVVRNISHLTRHPDERVRAAPAIRETTAANAVIFTDAHSWALMTLLGNRKIVPLDVVKLEGINKQRPVYLVNPDRPASEAWIERHGVSISRHVALESAEGVGLGIVHRSRE